MNSAAPPAAPSGYTFERAAREYVASQEAGWGPHHSRQWAQSLRDFVFPAIGATAIGKVDTDHVLRVLKPIWGTEKASRVRGRIERVLDWAKAKGKRNGGENPARWKGHMEHLLAKKASLVEHHEAVPVKDIPKFMAKVRACDRVPARALELLALTATRTDEVRRATLGEFDLEAKLWTIPAARTKTGKKSGAPHVVPLSTRAAAIVEAQFSRRRENSKDRFVFPGERGARMGAYQIRRIMEAIAGPGPTPHGLRSSFRDWCGMKGHPRDLAEMSLAHVVGSAVERAYARDSLVEQRREIMDAWAAYCGG
jgi:integrase